MTGLVWYARFPGDWMRETREQRPETRLAYVELLDAQWDLRDLPRAPEELRKLVRGLTRRQFRIAWPFIESKFPRVGTRRQNAALEAQRDKAHDLIERHRAGAQKTNALRWGIRPDTEAHLDRSASRPANRSACRSRVASIPNPTTTTTDSTEEDRTQGRTTVVDPRGTGR